MFRELLKPIFYLVKKNLMLPDFSSFWPFIILSSVFIPLGLYILLRSRQVFLFIKPELLRRNLVTYVIGLCFFFALAPIFPDFANLIKRTGWQNAILLYALMPVIILLIPYNITLFVIHHPWFINLGFKRHQALILLTIVVSSALVVMPINYFVNGGTTKYLGYSILWSFYFSLFGGLVYLFLRYNELDKLRQLNNKEMELLKLGELKTRAELEALQSKINPHFLYNALNAIADLSLVDGRKARDMTLALSDMFRYSINYKGGNYSSLTEEVSMADTYLKIEKVRFEDRLSYELTMQEQAGNYLVPRFLLQPLVENAVKHGLNNTVTAIHIKLEAEIQDATLLIRLYDNGIRFPADIIPGYGLKSVFEKLELLYAGQFEVKLLNEPQKYIQIRLQNPLRYEPAV